MVKSVNVLYRHRDDLVHARNNLPIDAPDHAFIQVFSGILDQERIRTLQDDLKAVFPDVPVIGTSTAGEIRDGMVEEDSVVVSITVMQASTARAAMVDQNDDLDAAGDSLSRALADTAPKAVIVFGCGLKNRRTIDATPLLSALKEALPGVTIAGAQAGDNGKGVSTFVFTGDAITEHGAVAMGLAGDALAVNNTYNLSWVPIGKKLTITKAVGPRVYTIDDRTPFELYRHYLGQEVVDGLPLAAADFPLIIERDGIPMAIHAIGINDDGSFDYIHSFHPGEQLQFGFCHAGLLALGARETYQSLQTHPVEAAFIYSCVSRRWILGADVHVEISPIADLAPTAGFFSYGEYFTRPTGKCMFFSQTMTVLTLAEPDSASPPARGGRLPQALTEEESKQLKTLRVLHRLVETSAREIESMNLQLAEIANRDSLTGLANRRQFDRALKAEIARAQRSKEPLSLIMMDVDDFKAFNDTYGHVSGDACLRALATILKDFPHRTADTVARYGGEELACILPDTDLAGAMAVAEKVREQVLALRIRHETATAADWVTLSLGVLAMKTCDDRLLPEEMIRLSDEQLYRAKSAGRNRAMGREMP
jgi:diguanylate cyclase (GGDEF)-like protein